MSPPTRIVLSASRRTDIPAFYLDWFMDGIGRGVFEVLQPYTRRLHLVTATPDRVHSIVLWSKDFGPFLRQRIGERLQQAGFHLFFNFTLNSADRLLEPRVPALNNRLAQLEELARRFDPAAVQWRFDPLCAYRTADGRRHHNRADFKPIADAVAAAGIRRCITSFVDIYAKVRRRAERAGGVIFEDPPMDEKVRIIKAMTATLSGRGIALETCCEADLLAHLEPDTPVRAASCIPSDRLVALYGGHLSLRRDAGQRRAAGCGCRTSVDIGSYDLHPCRHDCLFCYARPALDGMRLETGNWKLDTGKTK